MLHFKESPFLETPFKIPASPACLQAREFLHLALHYETLIWLGATRHGHLVSEVVSADILLFKCQSVNFANG